MNYRTGFSLHRAAAGAFDCWSSAGCRLKEGCLELDAATAARGSEALGYFSGEYRYGEATSPELPADFAFSACIPSWNADVPRGAWLELLLRVRSGGVWTTWRSLGLWAPDDSTVKRHSVDGQDDEAARVATDTLLPAAPADAFQARFRLFSASSDGQASPLALPVVCAFSLAYSDRKPAAADIEPSFPVQGTRAGARGTVLGAVPRCSQMVYPNGGNVWCSPTSVSMVLGFWKNDDGPCETRVRAAVAGVYDQVYEGHGNWSFNAAYAGSFVGMEAYVARFTGLDRLEPWIAAGVPVVLSVSWNNDEGRLLSGAPVSKSSGHLTTLVGFDDAGNAVMNEPASPSNETVRRTYDRGELERCWLSASGGVAYLIFPATVDVAGLFSKSIGAR
ncbi:MAG: hypothetical protein A2Y38_13650 [Spirochaetes bacterium GWB1_59_5]|nr:MAG: hypothetical protein A2Y38_13650 [Spirochaetes bacterium GWB1_59_5]